MVSKIEAAERLAEAVEGYSRQGVGNVDWIDITEACEAYRSASVPSDEDLVRLATKVHREYTGLSESGLMGKVVAAVREWVQRDSGVKLTDEEREYLVSMLTGKAGVYKVDSYDSILRKLGREPEPVWEWDRLNTRWMLRGNENYPMCEVRPCMNGWKSLYWLEPRENVWSESDSLIDAKAWCEQQLREANLKGANNEQD